MKGIIYGKTEYDMLNNASHLEEYILYAYNNQFEYLSITDPNLHGHKKFYDLCLKYNIKPLIGLEIKVKNDIFKDFVLGYALNDLGYKELLKISTKLAFDSYIELNDLVKYKNIIYIINPYKSIIGTALKNNSISELKFQIDNYQRLNHLYIGVSYQEANIYDFNNQLITTFLNFGIKAILLHENKYILNKDKIVYEIECKINNQIHLDGKYSLEEYLNYNYDEDLIINNDELVKMINYNLFLDKISLPKYKFINMNSKDYIESLAHLGLKKRLQKNKIINQLEINRYLSRLKYELDIINKMNFNDYFLIVHDFISFSKKNNILIGPGRGSAPGSLVAYSLGITEIDPLKYKLLFERFLNPERISMPDIDTDMPDNKRDDVLAYVQNKYSKNSVVSITTFGTYSYKSAMRDVYKFFKIDNKLIKEIEKLIKKEGYEYALTAASDNYDLYNAVYVISRLEGLVRNTSTHAAGIIISDKNLEDFIPLQGGISGLKQSQLDAKDLEDLGLLKIDFLGLKNLSIISDCLKELNLDSNFLRDINLSDKKVFEMLGNKDTLGIFQLESDGMRNVLKRLNPTKLEDITAALALYRPGPLDNIDEFIARKNGKKFNYIDESLKDILKETYGIIVYQEQIIQIAQVISNYTLGEADILRRAISKKNLNIIEEERSKFIEKGINNNHSKEVVSKIYDYIVKFASYGFNKSHSVAYATLAYYMAYLKTYYFKTFMSNLMNSNIGSIESLKEYNLYLTKHNISLYQPHINISTNKYVSDSKGLYLPLTAINKIGTITTNKILADRKLGPYKDFKDFCFRTTYLDVDSFEALIFSGALDSFNISKQEMYSILCEKTKKMDKYFSDLINSNTEYNFDYLKEKEEEFLGINIIYNEFNKIKKYRNNNDITTLSNLNDKQNIFIKFKDIKYQTSKNGNNYLKATIYDDTDTLDIYLFDDNLYKIINDKDIFIVNILTTTKKDFTSYKINKISIFNIK